MELYGIFDKVNAKNVDIVDLWYPVSGTPDNIKRDKQISFFNKVAIDLELAGSEVDDIDLILCNPPWIPATYHQHNKD